MTQQPPAPGGGNNPYGPPQPYGQQPQNPYAQPQPQPQQGQQPYGQPYSQPYAQAPYGGFAPGATPQAPVGQPARLIGWLGVVLGILAIVGCFGAWVTADLGMFHVSMNGFGQVSGSISESPNDVKDGVLVAILAAIVIVFGAIRGLGKIPLATAIVTVVMGLLSLAVTIYDVIDVSDNVSQGSVGWGLWLCLIASIAIVVVGIAGIVKRR